MLIKGTFRAEIKKVRYLMSLGLSTAQAHSLKRFQQITVNDLIADGLIQKGLAEMIKADDEPKVKKVTAGRIKHFEPETEKRAEDKK